MGLEGVGCQGQGGTAKEMVPKGFLKSLHENVA